MGIEVKIQNIERTERAKRDLLAKGEINTGGLAMARSVFIFWIAVELVSLSHNQKIETKMSRNANSSHARFSDTSGSLGSDGRFEPNVFGGRLL